MNIQNDLRIGSDSDSLRICQILSCTQYYTLLHIHSTTNSLNLEAIESGQRRLSSDAAATQRDGSEAVRLYFAASSRPSDAATDVPSETPSADPQMRPYRYCSSNSTV